MTELYVEKQRISSYYATFRLIFAPKAAHHQIWHLHIAMCVRVLRDALVSQVESYYYYIRALLQAKGLWLYLEQNTTNFDLFARRARNVLSELS